MSSNMAVNVETLEKLERRITLTVPAQEISSEVESRLKKLSRTVRADGFRPGKVPMSVVAQRYGYSVKYEVMNDKIGAAFASVANEAKLRVAGTPRISPKEGAPEGSMVFDATFEIYPEVKLGELGGVELERVQSEVTEAAIDRTIDILRKQRRGFAQRPAAEGAAEGDRVTSDFEGKIDGESFAGGKADAFAFVIGEGQMLEQFDKAVRGMRVGESKTFPLKFPEDYHGKDVAGKEADFLVTQESEAQTCPSWTRRSSRRLGITVAATRGCALMSKNSSAGEVPSAGAQRARRWTPGQIAELEVPVAGGRRGRPHDPLRAPASSSAVSRTPTRRRSRPRSSRRRPSGACAWAWWWASWCDSRACRPSPTSCNRTSRNSRRAMRSPPR
jgi:trigger factor